MSPFALYLIMTQEIGNLHTEQPRRFMTWPAVDRESGPSVLDRIRAAFSSAEDAPAVTPTLLDYPYRS